MSKAYPINKPSGVEWLGDVPEHWGVKRLKDLLKARKGAIKTGPFGSQLLSSDMYDEDVKVYNQKSVISNDFQYGENYISFEKFKELKEFQTFPGDFLITTRGTIGRCAVLPKNAEQGILHPCLMRLQTNKTKVHDRFLEILIEESTFILEQLRIKSNGTTIDVIYQDSLKNVTVLLPPLPEQQAIAAFLDHETGCIDALIAKKQRLLELLAEQRTALISHAVTKGLDASVKLKPSGVEWLGDVPEHWVAWPLKRIVAIPVTDGPHETPEILDEGIPFVSAEAIRANKIDFSRKRGFISEAEHRRFCLKYHPKRDDIYMIKSGATTGNLAIVETDEEFSIWSPLAVVRVHKKRADARFVLAAMNSKEFQTSVQLFWSFGTQQNIGMNVIENLPIPLPPLTEQQAIAAFLDRETAKIDALAAKVTTVIDRLKEYRTALISSVVTGKIDVREAV
jgi:type I restriction enzyme S subunit